MKPILTPADTPNLARMGGKGYALSQLTQADLPVPDWIIVSPPVSELPIEASSLEQFSFTDDFKAELAHLLAEMATDRFAVRSSAIDEDGMMASYAGQLDSFLNIAPEDVINHIVKVRQSGFNERVMEYRKDKGITGPVKIPAVVIQRMVDADAAGVAFSVDAVSGSWATAVVSAVEGLGEKLVSGEVDADTWRISQEGEITSSTSTGEGPACVLREKQVEQVATLARQCERYFGVPQDIEWAIHDEKLYLLQSRPITTLHRVVDPNGALNIWDNSNIAESYGGVTTPLTFSFAHYIYKEVYQQFCMMMHVPRRVVENNRSIFNGMLGLVRGRVYYNLMSWYRALALLPGFRLNHKFMEQMMGVKEGMPESVLAGFQDNRLGARVRDGLRLAWALLGLAKAQIMLPRMIGRFYALFNEALDSIPKPLESLRPDQLADHFHDLEQRLLSRWNAPLVNDFFAMVYFGILRSLTRKWCDDKDGTLQNGLLCGTGNIISAEPARRIHEMAMLASKRSEFPQTLASGTLRETSAAISAYPEFSKLYDQYMDRFADRCLNELKLESPTLRDDPLPLLRSIGSLAKRIQNGHSASRVVEHELQASAEDELRKHLKGKPLRRQLFGYVLKQTRRRVRDRENLRFERTRLFGRIRAIFIELGKRLAAVNALESPRDVLYLEIYEVLGFVEGTATTTDLKSLVAIRKEEFAAFAAEQAPADRFETKGIVNAGNTFQSTGPTEATEPDGDSLQGIGCCPGIVRGKARVVRNPAGAEVLPGEILVAEQTDPGWITLFPASSGVLVERGSLLSHSAIVSREMGIPSVVSLNGLLNWVKTGDEIEMNGTTGVVILIR